MSYGLLLLAKERLDLCPPAFIMPCELPNTLRRGRTIKRVVVLQITIYLSLAELLEDTFLAAKSHAFPKGRKAFV